MVNSARRGANGHDGRVASVGGRGSRVPLRRRPVAVRAGPRVGRAVDHRRRGASVLDHRARRRRRDDHAIHHLRRIGAVVDTVRILGAQAAHDSEHVAARIRGAQVSTSIVRCAGERGRAVCLSLAGGVLLRRRLADGVGHRHVRHTIAAAAIAGRHALLATASDSANERRGAIAVERARLQLGSLRADIVRATRWSDERDDRCHEEHQVSGLPRDAAERGQCSLHEFHVGALRWIAG